MLTADTEFDIRAVRLSSHLRFTLWPNRWKFDNLVETRFFLTDKRVARQVTGISTEPKGKIIPAKIGLAFF